MKLAGEVALCGGRRVLPESDVDRAVIRELVERAVVERGSWRIAPMPARSGASQDWYADARFGVPETAGGGAYDAEGYLRGRLLLEAEDGELRVAVDPADPAFSVRFWLEDQGCGEIDVCWRVAPHRRTGDVALSGVLPDAPALLLFAEDAQVGGP